MKNWIIALFILSSSPVLFGQNKSIFVYHRLMMKDLEAMNRYLIDKVEKSRVEDQLHHLSEAALTLFSRPNNDNQISKIISTLGSELNIHDLSSVVYNKMIDEALAGVKDEGNIISAEAQITYLIALENWMLEFKPRSHEDPYFEIYKKISESKLGIPKKSSRAANARMPYRLIEPSKLAAEILKSAIERRQKETESAGDQTGGKNKDKSKSKK